MGRRNPDVAALNALTLSEGARVVDFLQARGVNVVVLKGAALCETVYAIDERRMSDVDLLVTRGQRGLVRRLMADAGMPLIVDAQRPLGSRVHYADAFPSPFGMTVDMHVGLAQSVRWRVDPEGLFERSVPLSLSGVATRRLSNDDSVLYLAINQAKDEFATDGRAAEDVSRVVGRLGVDWPTVVARATEWRCTVALWLTLSHAQARTGIAIPPEVLRALAPSAGRRAYLSRFIDPQAVPPHRFPAHGRRTRQALVSGALTDIAWRHTMALARFALVRSADWIASRVTDRGAGG